jgi:hypothetical protein
MKRILLLLLLAALAAAKDSTRVIRIKLSSEGGLNTQRLMERDCQNYVLVDDSQKDQEYDYLLTVMHSERQGPYL